MKLRIFGREITVTIRKPPSVEWKHYTFVGKNNKLKMFINGRCKRKFEDFTISFWAGIKDGCGVVKASERQER